MNVKVVYNACYGGFSLSKAAAKEINNLKGCEAVDLEYGSTELDRHDVDLVSVVEKLGAEAASGMCAKLRVIELPANMYRISEYDGFESVETPDSQSWICV